MQKRLLNAIIVTSDFKTVFDNIILNIGINETLELSDFDRIFSFLQRNYGLLTLLEIAEAFDLYAAQKLEFKEHHFNSFDNVFIGKVLKSYGGWKSGETQKPKIRKPEEKYDWQMWEKEKHFNWLKDDVFLDESKRNGRRGEFPKITVASWKDVYEWMLHQRMTIEPMGSDLEERIKRCNARARSEKSDSNPFSNIGQKSDGKKSTAYYRYQVMDYFIENFK